MPDETNQQGQGQDPPAQSGPPAKKAGKPAAGMRRVRLTRSIILGGEHADAGSVYDVSHALGHRLIGEGSAEAHVEEGEEPEKAPTSVNRMVTPTNADPAPKQVAAAPPKNGPKAKK